MTRNTLLKWVNPVLAVLLINQILTGLMGDELPGEAFEVLHEGGGIALGVVAAAHIVLNWSWIAANFFRKSPSRAS